MVALPTPRPSQVDIDAFEEATRSEMREAMRRARAPMAADIDLGDPESFDFAMTGGITGSGRALIRDPLTGDLRTSQEPAMILTDKQRQAGNFAQGLAMGLTTDLLGLPADLLALILRDAPQLGAALTKSLTSGTPVAEEIAEMSKNPSLLDSALSAVQNVVGGDALARYAGATEATLQDPGIQTGRIAAAAFDPFLLAGLGSRARAGVESLTGEVMPDLPTGAPTRQEPSFNIGQDSEVIEGIGSLLPAPRTTDPGPAVGAPDTPVTTTPGLSEIPRENIPDVGEVLDFTRPDADPALGEMELFQFEEDMFHIPTGTRIPVGSTVRGSLNDFETAEGRDARFADRTEVTQRMATPEETAAFMRGEDPADEVAAADEVVEADFTVTPATAPEADEAAELFDAAATARAEPAEPESSLFESPEGGAQYAYDAVQNEQIGVFQSLPDRRSSNKTFTINDNDQFGGQVANFSSTMTMIAGRGERGKLPKKASQLDALFNKGVSKPEYNGSKLQEILKEDPDKSYTVDEIAKLAHDNLPQTRTRTYLASRHAQERDAGLIPDFFKTKVRHSYEVDPNGNIDFSPGDTQLLPELKDTRRDAGRIIFSTTKPPEPIVFSDGSVIDNIPFTVEKHDYGQGKYPGFYAHSRFVVVEDFDTGKRYLVPFEIQSDTINQIERARVAEGGQVVSARSLQDRLNKYNETGNTGTNAGMVRIPLTEETKALIKKYDEEFPSELTRHQQAIKRHDELMGDVNGQHPNENGVMVDAIVPGLQKQLEVFTGHPLSDSDVNGRLYNEIETDAFLINMKDDLASILNIGDATLELDAARQRVANGDNAVSVAYDEKRGILNTLLGYDSTFPSRVPEDLIAPMNSLVEKVLDARGFPITLKNTKSTRELVQDVLDEAIQGYIKEPVPGKQFEDYLISAINENLQYPVKTYLSAVRAKSLIDQNEAVAKFFRNADSDDLEALEQARGQYPEAEDAIEQLFNKLNVTDEQIAIADEAVDAAKASLKTQIPAESHSMIDEITEDISSVYIDRPFYAANDAGFQIFNQLRDAMDEVTKVYEGGDLIQDADELARIETNYENKLTAMGEEGEMLKNLRKVLQDSGDGRYRGLIGIPPHKDNKQFFRFAPKAIIKEAEKLGLDGVIFLDGDDIAQGRVEYGGGLDMYRRTYDSELDKGLADFQNASPDAVVRSGVNRRIPGDGNLRDPDNTFRARIIDNPEDFQLTAGAGIILGGRGQGLRIVDFDTGSNRQTAQRPIRRAKGGDVDLRPQKMIHSGIGAMAREVM